MDRGRDGEPKLEHCRILGRGADTDVALGKEEGEEVAEGVPRGVPKEEVYHHPRTVLIDRFISSAQGGHESVL